eukprot:6355030-Prymnesium_polylepis.1
MNKAWALSRSNADMDATRYWRTALAEAGSPLAAEETLDGAVAACEACVAAVLGVAYDETLRVARALKASGVRVGIISNHIVSPPWFQACASSAGLYELASDPRLVVVSQEVGTSKPEPAIYELFLDRLRALEPGTRPEELVFVDDKEKNVAAARAQGWRGLCFNATKAAAGDLERALAALGLRGSVSL